MALPEERTKGVNGMKDLEDGVFEFYQIYLKQIQEVQEGRDKSERQRRVDFEKEQQVLSGVFPNHSLHEEVYSDEPIELEETPSEKEVPWTIHFYFVVVTVPCLVSVWYSVAVFFPPQAREKYSLILWDDGKLLFDDQGRPKICPRPSMCSEGILQIVLFSIARVTAFLSYVFMGVTFLSKMQFTLRQLPLGLKMQIQHSGEKGWKIFVTLAVLHTVAHYIRYIVRHDADQLATAVHISGLIAILIISAAVVNGSCKMKIGTVKRGLVHNLLLIMLCIALCYHHKRAMVITLIFFCLWVLDSSLRIESACHVTTVKVVDAEKETDKNSVS